MKNNSGRYSRIYNFTFGQISFAAFIIAAVSGVFLAVPFDIKNPLDSISFMLLTNPGGVFFRNIHYWSAQVFLIFSILHIYDHLKKSTEKEVSGGLWIRLTFSLAAIFFVMISGFIIKADADSLQAKRILTSLIDYIPIIGHELANSLLGSGQDFQILYVHHIATATIFLLIIIIEHAKAFWPKLKLILFLIPILVIISYVFPPALHDGFDSVVKGPWYFLGLQEILHWLSHPVIILGAIIFYLIVFWQLPKYSGRTARIAKIFLLVSFTAYCILIVIGFFFRGENWQFNMPWKNPAVTRLSFHPFDNITSVPSSNIEKRDIPLILGRREGCMYCHGNVKGLSPAHNPNVIGCVSCHSGNPFTLNKIYAHRGMNIVPGNLADAGRSCGSANCHPGIPERVDKTLMTTLSGIISVDRYAFGETKELNELHFISKIGKSKADTHLRELCASCHLGAIKTEPAPVSQLSRGGGCNACHLNYDKNELSTLHDYQRKPSSIYDSSFYHPSLTVKITNDHCFGCHSRSGRISTNYEGWHDTLLKPGEMKDTVNYRLLEDGRVFIKATQDVHHEKGMDCIDCHNSYELMGDGKYYLHEENQVKIKCTDCHFSGKPELQTEEQIDAESQKIITLRKIDLKGRKFLTIKSSGFPLINTYISKEGIPELITKNSNITLPLKPPAFSCTGEKGHKNLSCRSCHTSWSPQCIGCHTDYKPDEKGYDLLERKEIKGSWIETPSGYIAAPPTLGIRITHNSRDKDSETVDTFIPGMILTINKNDSGGKKDEIFRRLFAPVSSHTITKESRSCESCHNDPVALGFGRGKLEYKISGSSGKWIFLPQYPLSPKDGLPMDAWTGFLGIRTKDYATRTDVRPFNADEQKNILTVGACLTCHKSNSKQMTKYLVTGKMPAPGPKCILPKWD